MDDGSRSEPIEIELTPEDGQLAPLRPDTDPPGSEPIPRPPADTRRLAIVALVTGLLALALGWMLGRSGSESANPAEPLISASSPVTTTGVLAGDPVPAVENETAATSEAEMRPTTTQPQVQLEVVDVHPAVAGRPIRLVGVNTSSELVTLDLATGELGTFTERRLGGEMFAPIAAGPDWVALPQYPQYSQSELMVLRDGEEPEPVDVGDVWELIRVPRTDRFWRPDGEGADPFGTRVFEELALLGGPTGRRVEVTGAFPVLADPAGALVGSTAGKVYLIDEDGSRLLGTGELIAIGADVAVLRDCDEAMRCFLEVLDRSTGAVTELPTDPQVVEGVPPAFWGFPPSAAPTVAPDGDFSVLRTFREGEPLTGVLDLVSGVVTPLSSTDFPSVEWSDDGRFAFYTDRATPMAWDSETGASFRIAEDVSGWNLLTVRADSLAADDG